MLRKSRVLPVLLYAYIRTNGLLSSRLWASISQYRTEVSSEIKQIGILGLGHRDSASTLGKSFCISPCLCCLNASTFTFSAAIRSSRRTETVGDLLLLVDFRQR